MTEYFVNFMSAYLEQIVVRMNFSMQFKGIHCAIVHLSFRLSHYITISTVGLDNRGLTTLI